MDIEFYFFSKWFVGNIIYILLLCKLIWLWLWVYVFVFNIDLVLEFLMFFDFFFFVDFGIECIKFG